MKLPRGWSTAPIGLLCTLENGRAFKPTEWRRRGIPIIRIQNLNNPNAAYNYFDGQFEDRYFLRGGELLFAWSGTPGTSFGAHIWRGGEAVLNQHIFRVDFDESSLDKRFFRYAINQKLEELIGIAHGGVGLRHVTKGKFENTEVSIPPLNEQKRIADKLDAVLARLDACCERLVRVPSILKRFRKSVLAAATSGELSEEWRNTNGRSFDWQKVKLADVASSRLGKMLDKAKNRGLLTSYLRNINVRWFTFDLSDIQQIKVTPQEGTELALRPGDILVCEGGEPGRCAIWRLADSAYVYQKALHRVRVKANLTPEWVCYSLKDAADSGRLSELFTGTTIKHLTGVALGRFGMSLPPLDEQNEIIRRVEALFAYADRVETRQSTAFTTVERITPAVLAKAFRGELVPQYPNDEPASELLERILAARAAAPEKSKQRKGGGPAQQPQKAGVIMLNRKDIQETHLSTILKERGPLTAEALWSASQLEIDDFYDQLKDEEARGLLKEQRGDSPEAPRTLQAAA